MSAHCADLNMFGGDEWNARAYGSLSIASSVSAHIKSSTQTLALRKLLKNLNSSLGEFFAQIRAVMDGKVPAHASEESTPETIAKSKAVLKDLDRVLTDAYLRAKRAGLTNRTVTGGQFRRLREHIDELQDLREWFEGVTDPESVKSVDSLFARAEREALSEPPLDLSKVR